MNEISEVCAVLAVGSAQQRLVRSVGTEAQRQLARLSGQGLRWGIRHGDPSLDNLHVDGAELYLYDFDLAAPGWQLEDLTGALSTDFAAAFMSGYTEVRPLSATELEALPWLRILSIIENLRFHLIAKPAMMGTYSLAEGWVDSGFESLSTIATQLGLADPEERTKGSSPGWYPRPVIQAATVVPHTEGRGPVLGVSLRTLDPQTDLHVAEALLLLQREAYAVEAQLLGDDRIPPLWESLEELRRSPLTWIGAYENELLLGAVAWSSSLQGLDLERLVVSPAAHRRGVGTTLVRHVCSVAASRPVVVSTGRDNVPARSLYERLGFVHTGDVEVLPRLWVRHYRRPAPVAHGS